MKYIPTIGIECHVQLATKTKLFSEVDNDARGKEPNSCVSPVDYALPGMLPRLNGEAIKFAIRAGHAMHCEINSYSRFDRKHYFYPDSPKGYQITQFYCVSDHFLCNVLLTCYVAFIFSSAFHYFLDFISNYRRNNCSPADNSFKER